MLVCSIDDIKIISKNNKYIKSRTTGNLILSSAYRDFKKHIHLKTKKANIEKPYIVTIQFESYVDIDAPIQAILDSIQKRAIDNDKNIEELSVRKFPIAKNTNGSIKIWVDTRW